MFWQDKEEGDRAYLCAMENNNLHGHPCPTFHARDKGIGPDVPVLYSTLHQIREFLVALAVQAEHARQWPRVTAWHMDKASGTNKLFMMKQLMESAFTSNQLVAMDLVKAESLSGRKDQLTDSSWLAGTCKPPRTAQR
jgi:hypothetical protein